MIFSLMCTNAMNPQADFGADYGAGSLVMTTEAQNQLSQQLKAEAEAKKAEEC